MIFVIVNKYLALRLDTVIRCNNLIIRGLKCSCKQPKKLFQQASSFCFQTQSTVIFESCLTDGQTEGWTQNIQKYSKNS